jgi:hypothetical protein
VELKQEAKEAYLLASVQYRIAAERDYENAKRIYMRMPDDSREMEMEFDASGTKKMSKAEEMAGKAAALG